MTAAFFSVYALGVLTIISFMVFAILLLKYLSGTTSTPTTKQTDEAQGLNIGEFLKQGRKLLELAEQSQADRDRRHDHDLFSACLAVRAVSLGRRSYPPVTGTARLCNRAQRRPAGATAAPRTRPPMAHHGGRDNNGKLSVWKSAIL